MNTTSCVGIVLGSVNGLIEETVDFSFAVSMNKCNKNKFVRMVPGIAYGFRLQNYVVCDE